MGGRYKLRPRAKTYEPLNPPIIHRRQRHRWPFREGLWIFSGSGLLCAGSPWFPRGPYSWTFPLVTVGTFAPSDIEKWSS